MRVSTAFNRLLQVPGAWVTDVVIGDRDVEAFFEPLPPEEQWRPFDF